MNHPRLFCTPPAILLAAPLLAWSGVWWLAERGLRPRSANHHTPDQAKGRRRRGERFLHWKSPG